MGRKFQGGITKPITKLITKPLSAQMQNCKTAKLHYFIHPYQSGVSHVLQESPRKLGEIVLGSCFFPTS